MKTIAHLNAKVGYRLVKVVVLCIFTAITILSLVLIQDSYQPHKVDDFLVICQYGNKESFYAREDKGIYLSSYDLREGLASISSDDKERLQKACGISKAEINKMLNSISNHSDNVTALFKVSESQTISGSISEVVGYSLLAILIAASILEILRRLTYYILLGKIAPPKIKILD